jgi:hypothetical protein
MHHIANLALLPQKENQQKSGRLLTQVEDAYLRAQISKLEDIDQADFARYVSSASSIQLRANRGAALVDDLTDKRARMLASYT